MQRLLLTYLLVLFSVSACRVDGDRQRLIAFPGAEGSGKFTTGGRGGKVIIVTNCNDTGKGSLRWAIEQDFPRTIVFNISGYIDLKTPITIRHGNLTIAGQSAPGGGICLRGNGLIVTCNNIILRYIRIRPGDQVSPESDAITAVGVKDIIIDHCSFSWATDELCALYGVQNFTLQNCILSESLNNATHPTRQQSSGAIWGGNPASFINNLLVHNRSRNPRIWGAFQADTLMPSCMEICNNVIYNWSGKCMYGGEGGDCKIVSNLFIPGPVLHIERFPILLHSLKPLGHFCLKGNEIEGFEQLTLDNAKGVLLTDPNSEDYHESFSNEIDVSDFQPIEAGQLMEKILNDAGASNCRDEVDKRIISDLRRRSAAYGVCGIISSQNEVGGWPQLISGNAEPDTDNDGMPDEWEKEHKLDWDDFEDATMCSVKNSYTNIELYLNQLCSMQ